jgi:hypothetical protein
MTHLWCGLMVQRGCRACWSTWTVSVRTSRSPCGLREMATFPSKNTDIRRRLNGWLGHKVHCKPTNTNLCLNCRSHHCSSNQQAILTTSVLRATDSCYWETLHDELACFKSTLKGKCPRRYSDTLVWVCSDMSFFMFQASSTNDILSNSHITDSTKSNGFCNGRAADYYIKASTADLHLRSASSVKTIEVTSDVK